MNRTFMEKVRGDGPAVAGSGCCQIDEAEMLGGGAEDHTRDGHATGN
jgi:hypothetical protein